MHVYNRISNHATFGGDAQDRSPTANDAAKGGDGQQQQPPFSGMSAAERARFGRVLSAEKKLVQTLAQYEAMLDDRQLAALLRKCVGASVGAWAKSTARATGREGASVGARKNHANSPPPVAT